MLRWLLLVSTLLPFSFPLLAQTPTATIDGRVLDVSKAVVQGATVDAVNIDTNAKHTTQTNANGLFTIVNLPPGNYRLEVSKPGFRTIVKPTFVLHVQDMIALNFEMSVGSVLESVTVEAGAPLINTESAAVATVVDRNFADSLPMNGRSFQTLIELTPGVVITTSTPGDSGQFSINGQRAQPMRPSSAARRADKSPSLLGPGPTSSTVRPLIFCATMLSMRATGSTDSSIIRHCRKPKNGRTTSVERWGDQFSRTTPFSFSPTRGYVSGCHRPLLTPFPMPLHGRMRLRLCSPS